MATPFPSPLHRAKYGGPCLCIGWILAALLCHVALAADSSHEAGQPEINRALPFDIDRLPLRQALEQYLRITGLSLLYDDAIIDGRHAGPLRGEFTPEEALRTLLTGTGLIARKTASSAFMLLDARAVAGRAGEPSGSTDGFAASAGAAAYYAALQLAVGRALCGDPLTIPGSYRLALRIWIGTDNTVERVLLHPTGDAARDQRIRGRLRGVRIPAPIPPGILQPMTLLILPRLPAQSGDCAGARIASPDMADAA